MTEFDAHGKGSVVAVGKAPADAEAPLYRTETFVGDDQGGCFRAVIAPHLPAVAEGVEVDTSRVLVIHLMYGQARFGREDKRVVGAEAVGVEAAQKHTPADEGLVVERYLAAAFRVFQRGEGARRERSSVAAERNVCAPIEVRPDPAEIGKECAVIQSVIGAEPPEEIEALGQSALVIAMVVLAVEAVIENFRVHIQSRRKGRDRRDRREARKEHVYIRHVFIIPVLGSGVGDAGVYAGSQAFAEKSLEYTVVAPLFELEAGSLLLRRARADAEEVPLRGQKVIKPDVGMRSLVADVGEVGFELASQVTQCAGEGQGAQLDPGNFVGGRKLDTDGQP